MSAELREVSVARQKQSHWPMTWTMFPWALSIVFLIGCGSGQRVVVGDVEFEVTFDGVPVKEGSVNLAAKGSGMGATQKLSDSGTVKIKNVPVGEYTVFVFPPQMEAPVPDTAKGGFLPAKKYPNIPQRFHSELTSPLRATVEKETKRYTFDLKKESKS